MAPRRKTRGSGKSTRGTQFEYSELDLTPRSAKRCQSVFSEDADSSATKAKTRATSRIQSSLGSGFGDDILDEDFEQLQDQLEGTSKKKDIAWSDVASVSRRSSPPTKQTPRTVGQNGVFGNTFDDSSDSDIEDFFAAVQEPKSADPLALYSSPKPGDNFLPATQTLSQFEQSRTLAAASKEQDSQIDFSETASTNRRSSPARYSFDSAAFDFNTSAPATPRVAVRSDSPDQGPAVQTPENLAPAEPVQKIRTSAQKLMEELRSEPDDSVQAEGHRSSARGIVMAPQTTHQSATRKKQRPKSPVQVDETTHRVITDWDVDQSIDPSPQPRPAPNKRRQPAKGSKKTSLKEVDKAGPSKTNKKSPAESPAIAKPRAAPKGRQSKKKVDEDAESAWEPSGRTEEGLIGDSGQKGSARTSSLEPGPAARTRAHDKKIEISPTNQASQDTGYDADQSYGQSPYGDTHHPHKSATSSPQEITDATLMDDTTVFEDTTAKAVESSPLSSPMPDVDDLMFLRRSGYGLEKGSVVVAESEDVGTSEVQTTEPEPVEVDTHDPPQASSPSRGSQQCLVVEKNEVVPKSSPAHEEAHVVEKVVISRKSAVKRTDIAPFNSVSVEQSNTTTSAVKDAAGPAPESSLSFVERTMAEAPASRGKPSKVLKVFRPRMKEKAPIGSQLTIGNKTESPSDQNTGEGTPLRQSLRVKRKAIDGNPSPLNQNSPVSTTEEDTQNPTLVHRQPKALLKVTKVPLASQSANAGASPRVPAGAVQHAPQKIGMPRSTRGKQPDTPSGLEGTRTVIKISHLSLGAANLSSPPTSPFVPDSMEMVPQAPAQGKQPAFIPDSQSEFEQRLERRAVLPTYTPIERPRKPQSATVKRTLEPTVIRPTSTSKKSGLQPQTEEKEIPDSISISSDELDSEAGLLEENPLHMDYEQEPGVAGEEQPVNQPSPIVEVEPCPTVAAGSTLTEVMPFADTEEAAAEPSNLARQPYASAAAFPLPKPTSQQAIVQSDTRSKQHVADDRTREAVEASKAVPHRVTSPKAKDRRAHGTRPLPRRISVNETGSPFQEDAYAGSSQHEQQHGKKRLRVSSHCPGPVYPERTHHNTAGLMSDSDVDDSCSEHRTKRQKNESKASQMMKSGFPVRKAEAVFEDIADRLSTLGTGVHQINRIYDRGVRSVTEKFASRREQELSGTGTSLQSDVELFRGVLASSRKLVVSQAKQRREGLGDLRTRLAGRLQDYDLVLSKLTELQGSL